MWRWGFGGRLEGAVVSDYLVADGVCFGALNLDNLGSGLVSAWFT